ncbi:MAG: imidazoleglycerol-phosphate dehydratase [Gemmatimonadaceae bacterium]|nr:imidazoleglycerol-phosphate dehydratase [Gemmatimonadaceae bacterium]
MKTITRKTRETSVAIGLAIGDGATVVQTGVLFLDHMLATLTRYAGLNGSIEAEADLKHHLIEDVGIVYGSAVASLASPGAARFAERTIPMDDALVQVVVDLGGRPYYSGDLPSDLYDHWMRSFTDNARCTLHIRVLRGRDRHHIVEAAFKALGLALRSALREDTGGPLSMKGVPILKDGSC